MIIDNKNTELNKQKKVLTIEQVDYEYKLNNEILRPKKFYTLFKKRLTRNFNYI